MIWVVVGIYIAVALVAFRHLLRMQLKANDELDQFDLAYLIYYAIFWPIFWPLTVLICRDWKQVDQVWLRKAAGLKDWES